MRKSKTGLVESKVNGVKQDTLNKLEDAAKSLMSRLFLDGLKIEINILSNADLYNKGEAYKMGGKYFIDLNSAMVKRDFREAVETLAHEMVHVLQYSKGWLKIKGGDFIWMGEVQKPMRWKNRPWEIQAVELEIPLADYALA